MNFILGLFSAAYTENHGAVSVLFYPFSFVFKTFTHFSLYILAKGMLSILSEQFIAALILPENYMSFSEYILVQGTFF